MENSLTPVRIVEELNKYIIGQDAAKRAVAVALRNRWRRLNAADDIRQDIMPNNILMIGNTGVGKTEIARRLAQLADAPFVKVEASKFTEVGYVGRDVESMVRDLVEQSVGLVKTARKSENRAKALDAAEESILDILIPPVKPSADGTSTVGDLGFAKSTEPVGFNVERVSDTELNERTRDKFREKLRGGSLDDKTIELEVNAQGGGVQIMGPMGNAEMEGIQDMLQQMIPKRRKKRRVTVAEAREILIEEEAEKLLDMDAVVRDAMEKASNSGIIFIDEIDKVAAKRGQAGGPDVSREGVQRDLLPIVEGSVVNTKYGPISSDHILFIAAGAFHVAKPSDLIPELQGRFPIRVELSPLTKEDFVKILSQPKNALTKQYAALLAAEGVTLTWDDGAIETIADMAFAVNAEVENIGARRLHTILSNLLEDILFQVPDLNTENVFHITAELVQQRVGSIALRRDLSEYIL